MLLRDFIKASLYDPVHGYFCKKVAPLAHLEEPIPFHKLADRNAYYEAVADQYAALQSHWLTPAEIFTPHIGNSIASYISGRVESKRREEGWDGPVNIVEIGAGTGTLAHDVLNWLRSHRQDLYGQCKYTTIDISGTLSEQQEQRVKGAGHASDVFQACVGDACEADTWERYGENECFIIGMEVLDNMPHDKVVCVEDDSGEMVWMESCVEFEDDVMFDRDPQEILRHVSDATIMGVFKAYMDMNESQSQGLSIDSTFKWLLDISRQPEPVFLPTATALLFDSIQKTVPKHELIFSDFDFLPDVVVPGENAPIVSSTIDGKARDRGTLFAPFGSSDIFFPTNFEFLKVLYSHSRRNMPGAGGQEGSSAALHCKASEFFSSHVPDIAKATTKSGFVPLIEDYSNTSFFLTRQRWV